MHSHSAVLSSVAVAPYNRKAAAHDMAVATRRAIDKFNAPHLRSIRAELEAMVLAAFCVNPEETQRRAAKIDRLLDAIL